MMHGDHGLSDKWYAFEESIKVPLIIRDPRMPSSRRGTRSDDFTLSIDLAPTMLAAAGIPVPSTMQGRDIADIYLRLLDSKTTQRRRLPSSSSSSRATDGEPWRQDFFYEWNQGRKEDAGDHENIYQIPAVFALVEKEFKYVFWPQFKYEQLFNNARDIYEEFDIFNATATSSEQDLIALKARYDYLKERAQNGFPV
jgi:arylsulfatase